jgi:hypothetical protein
MVFVIPLPICLKHFIAIVTIGRHYCDIRIRGITFWTHLNTCTTHYLQQECGRGTKNPNESRVRINSEARTPPVGQN